MLERSSLLGTLALVTLIGVGCARSSSGPAELKDGDLVKVKAIVKGDEVTVENGGHETRVRLVGVHAFSPVLADPQVHALSAGAVSALEEWVLGKQVKLTLDHTPKDPSGRYLGYLDLGGTDINKRLVETGWAVVYTEFPFDREQAYLVAESSARSAGRNVWALRPAADLVRGLRRQWLTVRHGDGKPALADALLQ
jgi:endonuclease YncB( thermonuclease family)